jgi:hypothetical protein
MAHREALAIAADLAMLIAWTRRQIAEQQPPIRWEREETPTPTESQS